MTTLKFAEKLEPLKTNCIAHMTIPGDGIQAPITVVLIEVQHEYRVWCRNDQSGGHFEGVYIRKTGEPGEALGEAYAAFVKQCNRYARHLMPPPAPELKARKR